MSAKSGTSCRWSAVLDLWPRTRYRRLFDREGSRTGLQIRGHLCGKPYHGARFTHRLSKLLVALLLMALCVAIHAVGLRRCGNFGDTRCRSLLPEWRLVGGVEALPAS